MHRHTCFGVMVLMLLSAPGLAAGPGPDHRPTADNTSPNRVQNKDIGANGAANVARHATGGRILSVKGPRGDRDGKDAYAVKVLLKGGRLQVLRVDAGSGALR